MPNFPDREGWYDLLFRRHETDSEIYETAFEFIYEGSIEWGTLKEFKIIAGVFGAGAEMSVRLYDITNNQVIGELAEVDDSYPSVISLGSLSNIPDMEAVMEVQIKRTTGDDSVAAGSALVRY